MFARTDPCGFEKFLTGVRVGGGKEPEDLPASLAAPHENQNENQSMTQLSAHIKELKELKELRIHMFMHLATLPDQMRALTELEKLEIDLCGLEALPARVCGGPCLLDHMLASASATHHRVKLTLVVPFRVPLLPLSSI